MDIYCSFLSISPPPSFVDCVCAAVFDSGHQSEPGGGGGAACGGVANVWGWREPGHQSGRPGQRPQDPTHSYTGQKRQTISHPSLRYWSKEPAKRCLWYDPVIALQVVPSVGQENGQTNEEEETETMEKDRQHKISTDKRKDSVCEEASELQTSLNNDGEANKGRGAYWEVLPTWHAFFQKCSD